MTDTNKDNNKDGADSGLSVNKERWYKLLIL